MRRITDVAVHQSNTVNWIVRPTSSLRDIFIFNFFSLFHPILLSQFNFPDLQARWTKIVLKLYWSGHDVQLRNVKCYLIYQSVQTLIGFLLFSRSKSISYPICDIILLLSRVNILLQSTFSERHALNFTQINTKTGPGFDTRKNTTRSKQGSPWKCSLVSGLRTSGCDEPWKFTTQPFSSSHRLVAICKQRHSEGIGYVSQSKV